MCFLSFSSSAQISWADQIIDTMESVSIDDLIKLKKNDDSEKMMLLKFKNTYKGGESIYVSELHDYFRITVSHIGKNGFTGGAEGYTLNKKTSEVEMIWHENPMKNIISIESDFEDISDLISMMEFEQIKNFVLKNGNRQFYRNIDSNNPHYKFEDFDVFLAADIGQKNINNDPDISDFNDLTIRTMNFSIRYYKLIIVREGDLKNNKAWILDGMKENKVYLVSTYNKEMEVMKKNLPKYLAQIKSKIKNY